MPFTTQDLIAVCGNFVTNDGLSVGPEKPGEACVFPIIGGPWPNTHPGAIKTQCAACKRDVGVSPKGMALHQEDVRRMIFCPGCGTTLVNMAKAKGS